MKNTKLATTTLIVIIVAAISWIIYYSVHKPVPDASAFKVPPPSAGAHPEFVLHKRIPTPLATMGSPNSKPHGQ